MLLLTVAACRPAPPPPTPAAVHVVGTDYAFTMPDSLPAGPTVVTFENRGTHKHEMVFVRLKPGVPPRVAADSISRGARTNALRATGSAVLFANPGERNDVVSLRLTLTSGDHWVVVCQFADSAGAPTHNTLGMFKVVTVP